MIRNPILRGFYPDPSICRVGDDFYIVNSSFSFYPGVPVFHSRDLVNWEQIGHVLDRPSQLHVTYEMISAGIFAPTIRYHAGTYYMITTNMTGFMNFIVTASDPAGPWSDPIPVPEAHGIDPSLFFDDDGKAYFCGTAGGFGSDEYDHQVIKCAEIDVTTGKFLSEPWVVGDGYAKNASSPEGPHIYKRNGWYYLLIAEGGTEHFHAVMISRSRDIHGPFELYQGNPILTHRHLGKEYPICNIGHADIVDTPSGEWYMVALASRLVNGYHKPLGRETFIMPMTWEDDWPVVCPSDGCCAFTYPDPKLPIHPFSDRPERERVYVHPSFEDFTKADPSMAWNYLGTPQEDFISRDEKGLALRMLPTTMVPVEFEGEDAADFMSHMMRCGHTDKTLPFYGRRLQSFDFTAQAVMSASFSGAEAAGLIIIQNEANQVRLEMKAADAPGRVCARAVRVVCETGTGLRHYAETILGEACLPESDSYVLTIRAESNHFTLSVGEDEGCVLASDVSGDFLGSETAGGFVGAYVGLFATGGGTASDHTASFASFSLENAE